MTFVDRILTIVITATLTSAVWIVMGGSLIENSTSEGQRDRTRPAEAAPSPTPSPQTGSEAQTRGVFESDETDQSAEIESRVAAILDTDLAQSPSQEETRTLRIPVLNIRASDLTDTFTNSMEEGSRLHEAIDIMAPRGTSVVAAAPGTIEKLFQSNTGGNTIFVRSVDGKTIYYYAHLDEYAQGLREGQRIRRGQRLGSVGSTGHASEESPHLHFAMLQTTEDAEWWEPANAINPFPLLTEGR